MSLKYLFGNWKMNLSRSDAIELATAVRHGEISPRVSVSVFPPNCWLDAVAATLRGSVVACGAQHCHSELKGPFTGETSPAMIAEMGARWCLVGHSERRRTFGESESESAARGAGALKAGLNPVICVGESTIEQGNGQTAAVVLSQLRPCLDRVREASGAMASAGARITDIQPVIAYEPVWSIGTGKVPTNEQVAEIAATINAETGGAFPLLYGGSVTPDNAAELVKIPGISGFLVGGSSLDPDKFLRIGQILSA